MRWCNPSSRRARAPHGRTASEARTRGATGEPSAEGGGSGAVLTGVLPAPRRRSRKTDATPSARNLGSIACQRFCIGCLGTVGGSLVTRKRGGWTAPAPRPTTKVHLRRSAKVSPHRVSHSATEGADGRNPASDIRATRSAQVALEAGLTRHPPLSLLSGSNCSHCRRYNVRTTSQPHSARSDRGLVICWPPFPTHTPPGRVSHLSSGPAGNPILVG